jgi:hypothetical protein
MLSPKAGAKSLLAMSSTPMTAAPEAKAMKRTLHVCALEPMGHGDAAIVKKLEDFRCPLTALTPLSAYGCFDDRLKNPPKIGIPICFFISTPPLCLMSDWAAPS